MSARAALLVLALAVPAAAQDSALPTLFDVTGVAAGDALNVRAEPAADAAVIGELSPDTTGIEVVARDAIGGWGRVNFGEGAGWVSLRYLAARDEVWTPGALPANLRCFGTEPFWSLRPDGDALVYSTPDVDGVRYALGAVLDRPAPDERRRIALAGGAEGRLTLIVAPEACSDGMSDRAFGLRADAVLEGDAAPVLLGGCCSVAP